MGLEYKAWWRFGLENYLLMFDLYHHRDDLPEGEIYSYIRKNRTDDSNTERYIFGQLTKLKFIQPVPGAASYYEVMHLPRLIIEFLEREYRFTSAKEIKLYLEEIDSLRQDLEAAFKNGNEVRAQNYLIEIANNIEKLRQSSSGNRIAITNKVSEVKINEGKESTAVRYERLLDIMERFITPVQEMIKVDDSLDRSLQQLENLLEHARKEYVFDRDQLDRIRRVALHIPRLRHDLVTAYQESLEEVTPLLDKFQYNRFGRGVTKILKYVDKNGIKAIEGILEQLSLPATRIKSERMDDQKVKEFIQQAKAYTPKPPPKVQHHQDDISKPFVFNQDQLIFDFSSALPVKDTFDWVAEKYQGKEISILLEIYKFLIDNSKDQVFDNSRKEYRIDDYIIHTHPLTIKELN
jgi:hypothetical protein